MSEPPRAAAARMWEQGGRRGAEAPMVPDAEFRSYYGRPVLKRPVWKWDIPAYLASGGVMAGSSLLAAGADLTGNRELRRVARLSAAGGLAASTFFLVHDLGRPERFVNMLRVVRPTSPMSIGSWLLAAYGPPVGLAALSEVTGRLPLVGRAAGLAAGALAPAVGSYTAVLIADTSIPAWHDGYRDLPLVFAGSASAAAAGVALALTPPQRSGPARRFALFGATVELAAERVMHARMGLSSETYQRGRAGRLRRWSEALTAAGAAGAVLSARSQSRSALAGMALLAGSICTRFAVFQAGVTSALDPKYTIVPQRQRVAARTGG